MTMSRILGTGHHLPDQVVTNFDLAERMETSDEFIVERTGIHQRRYAPPDVAASDLAVPACRAAVADAGLTMDKIDLLIMNTITPDHADPGCGFFLHDKLELAETPVFDIKQQCAGLIHGLSMADHYIRAETYRHVLIVCSEVLSTRIDASNDGRNIAVLLGDGAGAVVVGPGDVDSSARILETTLHADGRGAKSLYTAAPGSGLGRKEHVTVEDIEQGRIHFRMDGKAVFANGVERMSNAAIDCLERHDLHHTDIDLLIPHQANLRMLEAVIERTGFPEDKVFKNVDRYGNMASACLPVALDQARREGLAPHGSQVLLVAFGSGFVWGSALLRM